MMIPVTTVWSATDDEVHMSVFETPRFEEDARLTFSYTAQIARYYGPKVPNSPADAFSAHFHGTRLTKEEAIKEAMHFGALLKVIASAAPITKDE